MGARRRRPFLVGFVVGLLLLVPAVLLALLAPVGELLLPFLGPATVVLRPLAPAMATWPATVSLGLGAVVNGVIVGGLAALVVRVVRRLRRRRRPG